MSLISAVPGTCWLEAGLCLWSDSFWTGERGVRPQAASLLRLHLLCYLPDTRCCCTECWDDHAVPLSGRLRCVRSSCYHRRGYGRSLEPGRASLCPLRLRRWQLCRTSRRSCCWWFRHSVLSRLALDSLVDSYHVGSLWIDRIVDNSRDISCAYLADKSKRFATPNEELGFPLQSRRKPSHDSHDLYGLSKATFRYACSRADPSALGRVLELSIWHHLSSVWSGKQNILLVVFGRHLTLD